MHDVFLSSNKDIEIFKFPLNKRSINYTLICTALADFDNHEYEFFYCPISTLLMNQCRIRKNELRAAYDSKGKTKMMYESIEY